MATQKRENGHLGAVRDDNTDAQICVGLGNLNRCS